MDFVTCFAINVAQLTNLREQIHIAQIVFKDYNELLVFLNKIFPEQHLCLLCFTDCLQAICTRKFTMKKVTEVQHF